MDDFESLYSKKEELIVSPLLAMNFYLHPEPTPSYFYSEPRPFFLTFKKTNSLEYYSNE